MNQLPVSVLATMLAQFWFCVNILIGMAAIIFDVYDAEHDERRYGGPGARAVGFTFSIVTFSISIVVLLLITILTISLSDKLATEGSAFLGFRPQVFTSNQVVYVLFGLDTALVFFLIGLTGGPTRSIFMSAWLAIPTILIFLLNSVTLPLWWAGAILTLIIIQCIVRLNSSLQTDHSGIIAPSGLLIRLSFFFLTMVIAAISFMRPPG
jgi:hypothetical protein